MRRLKVPYILVADDAQLGCRSFPPLHALAAKGAVRLHTEPRWSWRKYGRDQHALRNALDPYLRPLTTMRPAELAHYRHRDVEVFACARSELLQRLLLRWTDPVGPNSDREIFDRAFAAPQDREDLLLCMAAACDRLDFWHRTLDRDGSFSHAVVHRGSKIAARALQEAGRSRGLRLFAVERCSIGSGFLFEERATPLSNHSLLSNPDWYSSLRLPKQGPRYENFRAEAHQRFLLRRDSNQARRSQTLSPPPFARPGPEVVAVLGQAADDFALIETPLPELSAVAVYRRLIGGILEHTDRRIVFTVEARAMPRGDGGAAATMQHLRAWRKALPAAYQARLRLIEEVPIEELLRYADWAVSLSSPEMLLACAAGLKPVQIGRAFFGGKGFTHDFSGEDGFLSALCDGRIEPQLSLDEYRRFEDFLIRALVLHLVPDRSRGRRKDRRSSSRAEPCAGSRQGPAWRMAASFPLAYGGCCDRQSACRTAP